MKENVFKEYQNTIHYTNRTGVRATFPDCHVPKEWGPKTVSYTHLDVYKRQHMSIALMS